MASTYAHFRFGKEVLEVLPAEISEIINKYRSLYDIGVHGPDLFFYYKPLKKNVTKKVGSTMHKEKVRDILEKWVPYLSDTDKELRDRQLSYLYGFITHFALDSCVHGYIDVAEKEYNLSHAKIEVSFDYMLLKEDSCDPPATIVTNHLIASEDAAKALATFYANIGEEKVFQSIKSMKFYLDALTAPKNPKRAFVNLALKATGDYKNMAGLLMDHKLDAKCEIINDVLRERYEKAIPLAKMLMENFRNYLEKDEPLCERFYRTFSWEDND